MPALFLSHSSADNDIAQRIVQSLGEEGIRSIFLDFDPELGIPVGRGWERELYRQLRRADGLVFLSSEKSIASRWCFAELAFARALGKPILPIAVDDAGRHPLLADLQHLALPNGIDERGLEQLRRSLLLSGINPNIPSWNPSRPPYPGLESFAEGDAAVFFGRGGEIHYLFERVNRPFLLGDTRAIVVIGSSGSGKSSLVRAGLVPRLLAMRERWVVIPRMVPGERPLESLSRILARACRDLGIDAGRHNFAQQLVDDADCLRTTLLDLCERASPTAKATCLLFVDQLEELMTLSLPSQRQQFLQLVDTTLRSDVPLFLVATLRSEFQDQLLREPHAAKLIFRPLLLAPLDQERLPEVIEAPAGKAGLEFAPGLVARITADTQGGDALPLLNYTLNQLYGGLGSSSYISHEMYDELGGVVGALQHQANQVVAALEHQRLTDFIVPTLLKLVRIGGDGKPVRRRVPRSTLSEVENSIVQTFIEARLLKSDGSDRKGTVEVAHEALLRQWPLLQDAIKRASGDLMTFARLNQLASDWEISGGHASYLQTGPALQHLLRLTSARALDPLERAYLDASIAYAKPSGWRRIIAGVIDLIVGYFVSYILMIIEGLLQYLIIYLWLGYPPSPSPGPSELSTHDFIFIQIFHLANFIVLLAIGYKLGGSPGMSITRLVLVSRDGKPVTWRQAIVRALLFWMPLHSRLSGTVLLRKAGADPW